MDMVGNALKGWGHSTAKQTHVTTSRSSHDDQLQNVLDDHETFYIQADSVHKPEPSRQQQNSATNSHSDVLFPPPPPLQPQMKKYLIKLANETANHLIRDTVEPEHEATLVWKPMTTIRGIPIKQGAARERREQRSVTSVRGSTNLHASLEEMAVLFKYDSTKGTGEHDLLFNQNLVDKRTLYPLVPPSADHPRRTVDIKWGLLKSPSKFFRDRDFCYLECQKEFRDPSTGRRGWVRSMHSIRLPCCPSLMSSHGIVRGSLYRCGLVAVQSSHEPGMLAVTYTIEMDLKGRFPEFFHANFLANRIAFLADIDTVLQRQRLSSSTLLGDLDLQQRAPGHRSSVPSGSHRTSCQLCYRAFTTFVRQYMCRKCGNAVCKRCGDDWLLDLPVVGSKKIRICTVCSSDARRMHSERESSEPMSYPEARPTAQVQTFQFSDLDESENGYTERPTREYELEEYDREAAEHMDHLRDTADLSDVWTASQMNLIASPSEMMRPKTDISLKSESENGAWQQSNRHLSPIQFSGCSDRKESSSSDWLSFGSGDRVRTRTSRALSSAPSSGRHKNASSMKVHATGMIPEINSRSRHSSVSGTSHSHSLLAAGFHFDHPRGLSREDLNTSLTDTSCEFIELENGEWVEAPRSKSGLCKECGGVLHGDTTNTKSVCQCSNQKTNKSEAQSAVPKSAPSNGGTLASGPLRFSFEKEDNQSMPSRHVSNSYRRERRLHSSSSFHQRSTNGRAIDQLALQSPASR